MTWQWISRKVQIIGLKCRVKIMIITRTTTEKAGKKKATRVDPLTTPPHIIPVVLPFNKRTFSAQSSAVER